MAGLSLNSVLRHPDCSTNSNRRAPDNEPAGFRKASSSTRLAFVWQGTLYQELCLAVPCAHRAATLRCRHETGSRWKGDSVSQALACQLIPQSTMDKAIA